jgi:cytochrome P450
MTTRCPLLYSCHQEILRLKQLGLNARLIEADTILSDSKTSYLVKKGNTIQLPVGIPQRMNEIWGPNGFDFDARRFLKTNKSDTPSLPEASKEQEKLRKKAYFPFSGGHHLCPGRHFATSEILGAVALLILGYEITTPDGGTIAIPRNAIGVQKLTDGAAKPSLELQKMLVRIQRREGLEDVEWKYIMAGE